MEKKWTWWKIILYIWAAAWPIGPCISIFSADLGDNKFIIGLFTVVAAVLGLIGLIYGIVKNKSINYFIIPYGCYALVVLLINQIIENCKYAEERKRNTRRCGKCGESYVAYHVNSCKICGSFDIVHSSDMGVQVFCKKCNRYMPGTFRCPHCGTDIYD